MFQIPVPVYLVCLYCSNACSDSDFILLLYVCISDVENYCEGKEGIALFNNTLNTFYLLLYDGHMVKDHSDSKRKTAATIGANLSN